MIIDNTYSYYFNYLSISLFFMLCAGLFTSVSEYSSLFFNYFFHYFLIIFFIIFSFLQPYLWHIEVPGLGVESELQLPATATATPDLSHICNLYHYLGQWQILDPTEWGQGSNLHLHGHCVKFLTCWATVGTLQILFHYRLYKILNIVPCAIQ